MIESSKKGLKIFLIILIIFSIIISIWFFSFNINNIKNGRNIELSSLIDSSFESKDGNDYLYFIDEEMIKIKTYNKDTDIIFNGIVNYDFNDGYIVIKEKKLNESGIFELKILDSSTIYNFTKNTYLYID